jgi:hypothetical protein
MSLSGILPNPPPFHPSSSSSVHPPSSSSPPPPPLLLLHPPATAPAPAPAPSSSSFPPPFTPCRVDCKRELLNSGDLTASPSSPPPQTALASFLLLTQLSLAPPPPLPPPPPPFPPPPPAAALQRVFSLWVSFASPAQVLPEACNSVKRGLEIDLSRSKRDLLFVMTETRTMRTATPGP